MTAETPTGDERFIAVRLNKLFREVHPFDRGPYTVEEIAQRCRDLGYSRISAAYIWHLRGGARDNPTVKALQGIAKAFDVDITYFFAGDDDADRVEADSALQAAMQHAGVRDIALRSAELDAAGVKVLAAMINQLQGAGLTRHEPKPPPPRDRSDNQ